MPTLGAFAFRHQQGKPYVYPDNALSYTANFLAMLFKMSEPTYAADERLIHALEVLFILHADHEQNCSTNAVRSVGSAEADPYSAVGAGIGALFGPLHGGANEAVLKMLRRVKRTENVPDFIDGVKAGKEKLMGFGHRVYKSFDPRAKIIKQACDESRGHQVNPPPKVAMAGEDRSRTSTSSSASCTPTSISTRPDLWALQFPPDVHLVVRHRPFPAGSSGGAGQDKEQKTGPSDHTGYRNPELRADCGALGGPARPSDPQPPRSVVTAAASGSR